MQFKDVQKITAYIPVHLLEQAQKVTHSGITETLKVGLEKVIQMNAYKELSKLRGAYHFPLDLDELREDRD